MLRGTSQSDQQAHGEEILGIVEILGHRRGIAIEMSVIGCAARNVSRREARLVTFLGMHREMRQENLH
jgi:hypothetical protein